MAQIFQYCQKQFSCLILEVPPPLRPHRQATGEGKGQVGPHSKWGEREVQNSSHRLEFCHDTRGHASPTCGSEQQGAVLSVQVLHCGDSGVPRVPVVEVVQLFSFLPVPKTAGRKNIRSVLGSQCKL